ncbi:MAG: hypothetical protein BWK79_16240 [Beggiatoa sp. IS2]|nr:MAG: hypothetical protein BWK79_16240 [Beggiatoa sp. IS2]
MKSIQSLFASFMLLCLLSVSTLSWATTAEDAQAQLQSAINKVLANPQKLNDLGWIKELSSQIFDFKRMSMLALGPNWKSATPAQQNQFATEFGELLVRTYSTSLLKAMESGETFKIMYLPITEGERNADKPKIRTKVEQGSNKKMAAVDYDMYLYEGQWKVWNVSIEGVSLVNNYRSEFANDVSTVGMDGLIKKIAASNQKSK